MVLWWGLWCWPAWRALFCALYYACGVAGVAASLRASSALGRGLPMLGLLAVRLASFAARGLLEARSGAGLSEALCHYVAMEARGGQGQGEGGERARALGVSGGWSATSGLP